MDSLATFSGATPPDRRLRRFQRITASAIFFEAYAQGRSFHGRFMVLWVRSGPGAAQRVGVVASRRVGESVARSRARRLLREAYRLNRCRLGGVWDVVLVARRRLLEARRPEIEKDFLHLARSAGLMAGDIPCRVEGSPGERKS